MKIITISDVKHISFCLAKELMSFNEPIPDFTSRFPNILESCLAVPFQRFAKKLLYRGLVSKAAILFYLMIKNHPFQNGNKRIAMTTLFVFLHLNKKWLRVDTKELYNFAMWVAQSSPKFKDESLKAAEKFIRAYLVSLGGKKEKNKKIGDGSK
ncbi:MAG: type II toxin-antitoxin system death-on-curing family toxin [Candidatus Omnitrophica bacterium]|nr:type II toxin-antitoxin system death-on-curing family toxin [Candidatus Omnitrophota bacterium]